MRHALALLVLVLSSAAAGAQSFPGKPVRLLVGYPPAGPADFTARLLAAGLQEHWGSPVVVENRPGASAMIAADIVARAAPDGYTLLLGTIQSHAMNIGSIKKLLYDPVRDFTAISQVTRAKWALAANADVRARTLQDLIATARGRPGELNYGSSGIGGVSHLAFEMFSATLGLSLTHIPYKGTAQAVADVVDGRVHLVIADQPTLAPHIQSGRLVVLATTGSERSAALAQLPALAEVAAGFDVQPWQGLFGPAGLPAGLAQKVSTDVAAVLRRPELQEKLAAAGIEAAASTPELFAAHVRREVERWTAAARSAGIQPE